MPAPTSAIRAAALAAALLSAGCGGGGGGDGGPPADTTPPSITAASPADGATGVARIAAPSFTFSEEIDLATVTASTVVFQDELGAAVAWEKAFVPATRVLTLTPSAPLANWRQHSVTFGAGVRDLAGNGLAAVQAFEFTTADEVAPGAPGTPAGPGAWATASPVAFAWTAATDEGSGVVSYRLEVATATDGSGTTVFSGDVGDVLGRAVAASDGQTLHARVRAVDGGGAAGPWSGWSSPVRVDLAHPAVATSIPVAGATGVARTGTLSVTFSEPIDTATVTDANFHLSRGTTPVPATASLDASGTVLTVTPAATLANYAGHVLELGAGLADLAGNALVPAAIAFTTADDVAPVLAGGVSDAGAWDDATVTFQWGTATDEGAGVAGYELQVALAASEGAVVASVSPATSPQVFDASALADGDELYARVRALDGSGNASAWSAWSDGVTVDAAPPGAAGAPVGPGAFALASPVHFAWTAASDAVSGVAAYRVQVASATDGTGETYFDGGLGNVLAIDVPAGDGKHLFARAAATDLAGLAGPWSAWSSEVVVDLAPPTAPGAPTDAGAFTTSPASFSWSAASDTNGVASYVLQVSTAPDGGGTVVYQANVGTALSGAAAAADGQILYARAAAVDVAGRTGPWSASSDGVTVDATGPTAPGAPADAGAFDDATVAFSWTAATAEGSPIVSYLLQVSPTADFSSGVVSSDVGTSTSTTFDASGRDGQTLHARVRAVDGLGHVGPFSPASDGVKVDLAPPSVPGVPQDGGVAQWETLVHFFWAPSTDAGVGVSSYTVEVRENGALAATLTTTEPAVDYTSSGALGAIVTASVRATDAFGNASAFSPPSDGIATRVPTAPGVPGTPTEVPPAAYTASTSLAFTWTSPASGGPSSSWDRYVVQVGTTPGGSDVVAGLVQFPNLLILSGSHGTTYYVRVAATSATGPQGAFSEPSDGITVDLTPPSAPGTPSGALASGTVTWTWSAAADAESGVASYAVEVRSGGVLVGGSVIAGTSYAFPAGGYDGQTLTARVRATNGAGTAGAWSAESAGVAVDTLRPWITRFEPWSGSTGVATGADVVLGFSEAMDRASVEAAFAMSWAGGSPRNGYVFAWNAGSTEVRIVPDTQDPVGATNVDLLPERTAVQMTVAATATDVAGNALLDPGLASFTTADETAPALVSLSVGGAASPVPPASVQQPFALDLAFDEDMDPTRAGVGFSYGSRWLEARYSTFGVQDVVLGAGAATYVLWDCPDVRVDDVVTVRDVNPPELGTVRARVTAVNRSGPCSFTVASSASGVAYAGGGWAAIPSGNGARPAWTGARTLSVVFEPWVALAAGSDSELEIWDVADAAGNSGNARTSLQVARAPGSDTIPPALLSSVPRAGGAAPGARMAILRFTEPLDRSTLSGITADCAGCTGGFEVQYQTGEFGPMVFVIPRRAAPAGAAVTVRVETTVRDLAGNAVAAPIALSYTASPSGDVGAPEILESLPPSGRPVSDVWDAQVVFADALTGALDPLDATTVGPEDVRVEDETGRLLRGWRPEVQPGSAFLRLTQPRGNGLSTGWLDLGIVSVQATAATGRVVYTTDRPHGMPVAGARVSVWLWNPPDQQFNQSQAVVREIVSPTAFALDWGGGDGTATGGGNASVPAARTYTVSLLGVPGATGVDDAHGNAMAPQVFEALAQPWPNRVPTVRDLRELAVEASTSPLGRALGVELSVRDADLQNVHVSVAVRVGASDVPLASYDRDVPADAWGSGWYRVPSDGGGPPTGDSDPALAALPTGLYPVAITLSDGAASTTYVREVFLWSPADAPALVGVLDGGVLRPMDGAQPPVVETGPVPSFRWALGANGAPDFLGLYVASLDGVGDQGGRYLEALVLPPDAADPPAPSPLEPDVYLWTVVQQRFEPGTSEPRSSAWALDFTDLLGSLFVVGPDNDVVGGEEYGVARAGFERAGPGALTGLSDATGLWAFQSTGAADPVFVGGAMTDNTGAVLPASTELFAYGAADRALTVTETVPVPGAPLPLPMRGVMGSGGDLLALAQSNEAVPSIAAGARRFQTSGFGTALYGRFAFVQLEARSGAAPIEGAGGSVGMATFAGPGAAAVTLTQSAGGTQSFDVPYVLADDGRLSLDIGDPGAPGTEWARGLVGGAPGAELVALAHDGPAVPGPSERIFWLLMARARDWDRTETNALLTGRYRFADLSVQVGGGGTSANGSSGTLDFDGAGGFTYAVQTAGGPMTGAGTYAVDAVAERVVVRVPGPSGESTLTFVVGPDFDTLLGVSTGDPSYTEVLVVAR